MGSVIALPKRTRIRADAIDLPPCGNEWGPLGCTHAAGRRPRSHKCWTWTGWLPCAVGGGR